MDAIRQAAQEICEREGCFLWDLEFLGSGRNRTLRVTIEGDSKDVSLEDCEKVSNALNLILDVKDLVPGGAYQLEVSSPGVERKLKEAWHFAKVLGRSVDVLLSEKIDVTKGDPLRVRGLVEKVEGEKIWIRRIEGDEVSLDFPQVKRAKTVFEETIKKKRN